MKKIMSIVLLGLLLSGCASFQVKKSDFFEGPKTIVVGEITYKEGKITEEEIEKGKELIFTLLEKELPDYRMTKERPVEEDFLELEVRFNYIRPASSMIMSGVQGRMILFYKEKEILEIGNFENKELASGILYGRQAAFYQFLRLTTQRLIKELRKAKEVEISSEVIDSLPVVFQKEKDLGILLKESLEEILNQLKVQRVTLTRLDFPMGYIYAGDKPDYVYPLVVELIIQEKESRKILFLNQKGVNLKGLAKEIIVKAGI